MANDIMVNAILWKTEEASLE